MSENNENQVHPLLQEAIGIYEPRLNKLFSEEMHQLVRFLKFADPVECCFCGKKLKNHWTLRCNFKVADFESFHIKYSDDIFIPGSPVCSKHLLKPAQ